MPAPLPEDDVEVAALVAWLDCFRDLLDRRYPPSPSAPDPDRPDLFALLGVDPTAEHPFTATRP
jgi:hypothetical protein